jgi:hypothetical protein
LISSVGCEQNETYSIKVDAVQNPEAQGLESYTIKSSNAQVPEHDIWFKETEEYVKRALDGNGLYEAPDPESADMIVDIAWGVSEPLIEFEVIEEPVTVMDSGQSTTPYPIEDMVAHPHEVGGQSYPTEMHVYSPPEQEIVRYKKHVRPVTRYEKYLRITARVNDPERKKGRAVQAWSIYVTSKDESDDVRKYLPVLTAASVRYVGKSTEKQEEIQVKGKDEVVAFIKDPDNG